MYLYAKYITYIDVTNEVNNGEDISDLLEEKEPSFCYQCSLIVQSDVESFYNVYKDGRNIISYVVFKPLGEYTNEEEKEKLTDDVDSILYLCMHCSTYEFELKDIIENY